MKLLIPEFDEESHAYKVNGKPAPGVTSILRDCGIGVNSFWTDQGREFGKAVHLAIQYYAESDLDCEYLDDSIKPRLCAYVKFCNDHEFNPKIIEQRLYRENPLYCGMIDQAEQDRLIVDFKCGPHRPEHAIQLAAYAHLLPNPHIYERWGVHLMDNGKYKIERFKKQNLGRDYNVFLSCLNISNWGKSNGNRN